MKRDYYGCRRGVKPVVIYFLFIHYLIIVFILRQKRAARRQVVFYCLCIRRL